MSCDGGGCLFACQLKTCTSLFCHVMPLRCCQSPIALTIRPPQLGGLVQFLNMDVKALRCLTDLPRMNSIKQVLESECKRAPEAIALCDTLM